MTFSIKVKFHPGFIRVVPDITSELTELDMREIKTKVYNRQVFIIPSNSI